MNDDIKYHTRQWLRLQHRIANGRYPDDDYKTALLSRQNFHASRFCALQGNEVLDEIKVEVQQPPHM